MLFMLKYNVIVDSSPLNLAMHSCIKSTNFSNTSLNLQSLRLEDVLLCRMLIMQRSWQDVTGF